MIEEEEWSKEQEANRKPGQKHPTPSPVRASPSASQTPPTSICARFPIDWRILTRVSLDAVAFFYSMIVDPVQGFADRVFYESLLHQRPESKMAQKWCLEYGVLKWTEAEALCKELGVAINVSRPGKSPTNAKKVRSSKSRAMNYDKQEALAAEAMGLGGGNSYEGIGLSTL